MKIIFTILIMNTASILSVLIAGYLCINSLQGWGWFLLVAFLLCTIPSKINSSGKE